VDSVDHHKLPYAVPREAIAFDAPNGVAAAKAAGIIWIAVPNPMTRDFPPG
jgi:beta-phosphoglucomutase-like phosphatase (HAD superfamily)